MSPIHFTSDTYAQKPSFLRRIMGTVRHTNSQNSHHVSVHVDDYCDDDKSQHSRSPSHQSDNR